MSTTQHHLRLQICPKCQTTEPPRAEPHAAGTTLTCPQCGRTEEYDRQGRPYAHPAQDLSSVTHDHPTYPLMLACTTITLHRHQHAVRLNTAYVTDSEPTPVTIRIYHQPFRTPVLSFRATRAKPQPGVAYIYAAEMDPYEKDIFSGMTRQPKDLRLLIQRKGTQVSGLDLRNGSGSWHICPPGTILVSPLAPSP